MYYSHLFTHILKGNNQHILRTFYTITHKVFQSSCTCKQYNNQRLKSMEVLTVLDIENMLGLEDQI
jgi:DNA integrity scanning protein DisA with diadenylate cyclase activity